MLSGISYNLIYAHLETCPMYLTQNLNGISLMVPLPVGTLCLTIYPAHPFTTLAYPLSP